MFDGGMSSKLPSSHTKSEPLLLLSILRQHCDHLTKPIWLASVTSGKGFYLLDEVTALAALADLRRVSASVDATPGALLAAFLRTVLPFEMMHTRFAIAEGKCIEVNLDCVSACNFDPQSGVIGVQMSVPEILTARIPEILAGLRKETGNEDREVRAV
jgi:hypothetical protein